MPDEMRNPYGLLKLGVENVKPIITRGILMDVAGYKGVDILPEGYEITLSDVRNILAKEGLTESDIEPGDALLFNLGWWRHWPNPITTGGRPAYISREVVDWIGIFNLEFMTFEALQTEKQYKFLFVLPTLRLKGATGSPSRPIAIFWHFSDRGSCPVFPEECFEQGAVRKKDKKHCRRRNRVALGTTLVY